MFSPLLPPGYETNNPCPVITPVTTPSPERQQQPNEDGNGNGNGNVRSSQTMYVTCPCARTRTIANRRGHPCVAKKYSLLCSPADRCLADDQPTSQPPLYYKSHILRITNVIERERDGERERGRGRVKKGIIRALQKEKSVARLQRLFVVVSSLSSASQCA